SLIGNAAHKAIKCINLANKMSLSQTTNGRVTGHDTNCIKTMRHESSASASTSRSCRRLTARMSTTNNNDIKSCHFGRTLGVHPDASESSLESSLFDMFMPSAEGVTQPDRDQLFDKFDTERDSRM